MRRPRPFFGWYVVAAAFCIAMFGWGFGFYGLAVYIAELQTRAGWSVALLGSIITVYYLFGALLLGFYDSALSRFGHRAVTMLGIVCMAAGVLGVAFAETTWQLLVAFLIMALGWSTMSLAAVTAIVSTWFERRRGLALSLALNGASCGGIVLAPGLLWLSSIWGFQVALTIMAGVMIVLLLPITFLLIGRSPGDIENTTCGDDRSPGQSDLVNPSSSRSRRDILTRRTFWLVAVPFAFGLLAQVGFITHQVAFLAPYIGTAGAATALSLTTAAAVAGRLLLGLVVDRCDPRLATAACLTSQALALSVMAVWPTPAVLFSACVVFGLSVGNLITLPALVVQREFASQELVLTVGLIAAICQILYAFGPGLIGVIRELTGGYTLALVLCVALEVVAAAILCFRRDNHAPA